MHDVQLFQHVLLVRSTEETIFGWRTQVGDALPPWALDLYCTSMQKNKCFVGLCTAIQNVLCSGQVTGNPYIKVPFGLRDLQDLGFDAIRELARGILSSYPLALALPLVEYEAKCHCNCLYYTNLFVRM